MIDYNELMAWDKNDLAEYILTLLEESDMKDTREFLWVFDHSDNVIHNYPLSGDGDYYGDLPMYDCLVETEESFLTRQGFMVSTITTPGNVDWMIGRVAGEI